MMRALLLSVAGWVHREQQRTIEYLVVENRVLGEQLASGGVETIFTPPRSPNCNAYAEQFVRSIKEERLLQRIGNRVIERPAVPRSTSLRSVTGHERLGGILRHYRASASPWDSTRRSDCPRVRSTQA